MAKRKTARRTRRTAPPATRSARQAAAPKPRAAKKSRPAAKPAPARGAARKPARAAVSTRKRKASTARRTGNGKGNVVGRKAVKQTALRAKKKAKVTATAKAVAKAKTGAKAKARPAAARTRTKPSKVAQPRATVRPKTARPNPAPDTARRRHVLDLGRDRRRIQDDDLVTSSPPSSLNLDRTASAARSGRQELRERYEKHTESSPTLTAGDVDADWESAYSVGDEAPGGDNPTPDQNVVDDIGAAVGVQYDDNEELEGAERIEERDRHRWEYDPASSDDFDER